MAPAFDIRRFAEIDSTNTWLAEQARAGAPGGIVAVADVQTAGRGRLGRRWLAPPRSSLLMSVLLRPRGLANDRLHLATAAVAMSGADAVESAAGFAPDLKWPNDLLARGRKLGGVLTEVEWGDGPAVVVGIGINCTWPDELPDEIEDVAIAANHVAGRAVDRDEVLTALLDALGKRLESSWDDVGAEYRERCATVGAPVRVVLAEGEFTGTARRITDHGHLVVATEGGEREVTAGDVIHLR